eukprot:2413856-Rhodomonas_salina.2
MSWEKRQNNRPECMLTPVYMHRLRQTKEGWIGQQWVLTILVAVQSICGLDRSLLAMPNTG